MPPPVAPLPDLSSFHTVSRPIAPFDMTSFVPPQPTTDGLDAGKSTCNSPSLSPSVAPLSPAAAYTVMFAAAASANSASYASICDAVQPASACPQLIEMIDGRRLASCTADAIAS